MRKIDWGTSALIVFYNGTILGLMSKSLLVGILVGVINLIGCVVYGLMFGEEKKI